MVAQEEPQGIRRGQIWWANLDPTIGCEMQKTRPCMVIQNDTGNRFSPTTIIAPLTSTAYDAPIIVEIKAGKRNGLKKNGYANLAQIRCIDKRRLLSYIGELSEQELQRVNQAIRLSLAV